MYIYMYIYVHIYIYIAIYICIYVYIYILYKIGPAEKFPPVTHGTIYVRASPAVCLQRLHKRARGEEVPRNVSFTSLPLIYVDVDV